MKVAEKRKRLEELVKDALKSEQKHTPYVKLLMEEKQNNLDYVSHLCVGLLTAAGKNPSICSASSLCFILQNGLVEKVKDETFLRNTILETLRMTCLR